MVKIVYITVFGLIWMFFILICFLRRDLNWMTFALLFSMIFQSNNVFVINSLGVGPQIITSIVFIVKSYMVRIPNGIGRNGSGVYTSDFNLIFIFILIGIFSSLLNNEGTITLSKFSYLVLLTTYMHCFQRVGKLSHLIKKNHIDKMMRFIVIFVLCVGFIQVLIKKGILPDIGLMRTLIYNDTLSISVIYNTKSTARMYSTFMESSYCGAFLLASFFYFAVNKNYKLKDVALLILILIGILLTMSSTAYAGFLICCLIWLLSGTNKKFMKILLPILIFILLLFFTINVEIIQSVVLNKFESSSGIVRGRWNIWAIDAFKRSPIFGVGYKNQRASSIIFTILGELGIVGFVPYICMIIKIIFPILNKQKINNMESLFAVCAVIVSQIIACPDLDFSVFWWTMYIFALTSKKIGKMEE